MKLRKLKILFGNSVQCEKYGLENFLGFICTEKSTIYALKAALNNVLLPTLFKIVTILINIVTPDCKLIQAQQC